MPNWLRKSLLLGIILASFYLLVVVLILLFGKWIGQLEMFLVSLTFIAVPATIFTLNIFDYTKINYFVSTIFTIILVFLFYTALGIIIFWIKDKIKNKNP
ncbi:hypothetical protein HYW75_05470 [Candidatus Pacearchaeota archaeon]|nr:hypothetical protein [Candidatus Pacearchaeota archaeon]